MLRTALFRNPFLLGFDEVERLLERAVKAGEEAFPPYNIEQIPDQNGTVLKITLAVAGFSEQELSVTIEENQLVISGQKNNDDDSRVYLHQGIASRAFQRIFILVDGINVTSVILSSGLLSISLHRPQREKVIQKIDITARQDKQMKV